MALDENKLHDFLGRALVDLGGAINAVLMSIGDALGLYKALAAGPQSSAELADNTNTNERYIREWLNSQAAGGYVLYDKATGKYSLSEEQELCLANPDGPVDLAGASLLVQDFFHVRERALENFRRHLWPATARSRPPSPEQAKARAMPADNSLRLDDH